MAGAVCGNHRPSTQHEKRSKTNERAKIHKNMENHENNTNGIEAKTENIERTSDSCVLCRFCEIYVK